MQAKSILFPNFIRNSHADVNFIQLSVEQHLVQTTNTKRQLEGVKIW